MKKKKKGIKIKKKRYFDSSSFTIDRTDTLENEFIVGLDLRESFEL